MAQEEKAQTGSAEFERTFTRNPLVTIVHCGDDEVVVKHGSRSRFTKNIRDDGRTKLLGKILRNLVPPASLAELHTRGVIRESEVDDSLQLVAYLRDQGVLIDPSEDLNRVYLETILGAGVPFAERTVGIVGAGYLGSRIASQLARLGVGKLALLDGRRVQREAVDRCYFELQPAVIQSGRPFVDCVRDDLVAWAASDVTAIPEPCEDEAAVTELARGCDFLVVALEIFSSRVLHLVNSVAIELEKPWMSVYADGSEALVGPLYVPGESCCYNEFEIQHEATLGPMKDEYLVYKEALNEEKIDGSHFVLPPYLSVMSGLAVTGILRFLLSGRSFLVGRCNRLDFERLSVDYEEVLRLPRCPACGPSRPGYRHLFM